MESFSIAPSDSLSILKYEENDRIGFIRKVYSIVSFQLLFTTVIVALTMASHSLEAALSDNPWLIGLAILGNCASAITLICFPKLSHKVPANYCLLGVFTICEALLVALICTQYEPSAVLLAGLMSCSVTLVLTVYACTTKDDFSMCYGMLMVLLVSALYFVILMPLLYESMPYEVACSCLFVPVYGLYIIVDVQLIVGEGHYNLSTDDYILGSLYLYIDIIGLFIRILRLIGRKKEQA